MSRKEQEELRHIEEGMTLDRDRKVKVCKYPLIKDPNLLTDNRVKYIAMAARLEKQLERDNMLNHYNQGLQEFLDRPCLV